MDVQYGEEIHQQVEPFGLLEQATALLAQILGPQSSQLVKAKWSRIEDNRGRMLYRLTIRDFTGEVSTDFALDELQNPLHMKFRLARLWGDLLQIRNDQQHHQVEMIIGAQIPTG